jgi:doxX
MKNVDLGLLFIRLGLGICLFMHGFGKILHGLSGVKGILVNAGLPGFLAYFSYLGEVLAPIMLIIGFCSRVGAILVLGTSITILYSYYGFANLFALNEVNGFKSELIYLYIAISLCILFIGSGKYAVKQD